MYLLLLLLFLLLALGALERFFHLKHREQIKVRIHVNGIRGKTSVTRLIGAGIRQSGLKTLTKTTGTAARLILDTGEEIPYRRKILSSQPSISEQKRLFALAVKRNISVLVTECMAVHPEIQRIAEKFFVQSHICVITNVRYDHTDVMGTNYKELAESLALTIPTNGKLVLGPALENCKEAQEVFIEVAKKKNTQVIQVSQEKIIHKNNGFEENKEIALTVCDLLNIPRENAIKAMEKAMNDPGVFKRIKAIYNKRDFYFLDAFSANDPESTLVLWEESLPIRDVDSPIIVGLFNNRSDRGFRIPLFAEKFVPAVNKEASIHGKFQAMAILGQGLISAKTAFNRAQVPAFLPLTFGEGTVEKLLENLIQKFPSSQPLVLFGFGNSKGMGNKITDWFQKNGSYLAIDNDFSRSDIEGVK